MSLPEASTRTVTPRDSARRQGLPGSGAQYTSLDIALLAGVSQSTVSRALNGNTCVGAATRQRIKEIAAGLDYQVDLRARQLRTRKTGAMTLLMFAGQDAGHAELNPFYLAMLAGLTLAAHRRGYDLMVSLQQLSADWHADYLRSRKSDGLIVLGYGDFRSLERTLRHLVAQQTRFVRWGSLRRGQCGLSVGCDNVAGAAAATRHLVANGRRAVAFLGEVSASSPECRERHRGYTLALREAGLPAHPDLRVDAALGHPHAGAEAVSQLLAQGRRFDAIVGASDQIAISAVSELHRRGLRVPDDVAVIGFDDIPLSALTTPALSTVRQDPVQAGEHLVDLLAATIEGRPAESVVLAPQLVVRESCGGLRSS
ncbi:LacI family DNA-binding transcriptional regulator [Arenimonas sp. MALMAid1274]|uniref:LacI family DNA-binding transcriptional regulator n=1 Tax=Arenimonas sp. MALMAid1274 TaxID=3411630 RepID=UPI003B9E9D96